MAYIKFNKTSTLDQAKASTNPNKVFFPTDSTSIVLNGQERGAGTVTQVKVGSTAYNPSNGVINLPAYPTTKADVGLDNVDNTSDLNKPISTAVQNAFDTYNKVIGEAISEIYADVDGLKHREINEATYKQSGLMHFEDKMKLDSIESGAQVHIAPTEIEVKRALSVGSGTSKYLREDGTWVTPPNDDTHTNKAGHYTPSDKDTSWASGSSLSVINQIKTDNKGHVTEVSEYGLTLDLLGLNNVTNDAQVKRTEMGVSNGVATLDSNGLIISSQLPGYVDDIIEGYLYNEHCYADAEHTTIKVDKTGKSADRLDGKIYVNLHDSNTYRWSGSVYVEISKSLALGATSTTAFRGDYGNTAYSHATDRNRLTTVTPVGLYKVGSTAEGHIVGLTAIEKSDITTLGIPEENTWRPIKVKGTSLQSSAIIDFIEGNNITIEEGSPNNGSIKISASWRPLGTGANDACAGNDSRLSDARPASDVYNWAKQSGKPEYAINEITGLNGAISDRDRILAEAIAELKAEVEGLKKVINSLPQWVDAENGYMINGQKMFDVIDYDPFEESKPELPKSIGLIRYSTRSERTYVSVSVTNDVNDWVVC